MAKPHIVARARARERTSRARSLAPNTMLRTASRRGASLVATASSAHGLNASRAAMIGDALSRDVSTASSLARSGACARSTSDVIRERERVARGPWTARARGLASSSSASSSAATAGRVFDVEDGTLAKMLPEAGAVKALTAAFEFVSGNDSGEVGEGKKKGESSAAATRRLLARESDDVLRAAIDSHRRIDVRGSRGVGKSVALARLVMRARADGWVVAYVPDGLELTRFSYFSKSTKEGCDGLWETPDCAMRLLQHIANAANEKALNSITLDAVNVREEGSSKKGRGKKAAGGEEVATKTMSLFEYAKAGSTDPEIAVECAIVVLNEIRALAERGEHKVMFVVDQFNALFGPSDMHEVTGPRSRKNIPVKNLRVARAVLNIVDSSLQSEAKHVVVTAASESIGISKANTEASRPMDSPTTVALDTPKFSADEIAELLREYKRVGVVRAVIDERTVAAMKALTNGNPREVQSLASTLLR